MYAMYVCAHNVCMYELMNIYIYVCMYVSMYVYVMYA